MLKTCGKCEKEKPIEEFRKCKRTKDHLFAWCVICQDERNKFLYEKNKQKRIEQISKWNREHPDKLKVYKNKWNEKNSNNSTIS